MHHVFCLLVSGLAGPNQSSWLLLFSVALQEAWTIQRTQLGLVLSLAPHFLPPTLPCSPPLLTYIQLASQ